MKSWNAAEAKRRFARILQDAGTEPQLVLLRGKPVGVFISYEAFMRNRKALGERSLGQWIEELSPLHEAEGDMELPPRVDRPDAVGDGLP